jgi:Domain of unknown function (DUF1707)
MAGSADERAVHAGGRGHLRASHADRDQVIGTLKAAFVQGMLTKDELDLRVGQTLASRTYAELAALTDDLPAGLAAAESPRPGRQPVVRPGRVLGAATAMYGGGLAYALLLSPHGGDNAWAPFLLLQGFLVYFGVLMICLGAIVVNRQDQRSGGQPPRGPGGPGPASRRRPPSGPGREFPLENPGHRHTAETAGGPQPRTYPWCAARCAPRTS